MSVFGHFVGLALKGLSVVIGTFKQVNPCWVRFFSIKKGFPIMIDCYFILILIILESFLKIIQRTTVLAPVLKPECSTLLRPCLLIF